MKITFSKKPREFTPITIVITLESVEDAKRPRDRLGEATGFYEELYKPLCELVKEHTEN